MPMTCGLCGSAGVSHLAWCLRCTAAHSLVTMPVVSHSQKRKKWLTAGCSSRARCAWQRCRKTVTPTMVMCVRPNATSTISHQVKSSRPENSVGICLPFLFIGGGILRECSPVAIRQSLDWLRLFPGCRNDAYIPVRKGNIDFCAAQGQQNLPADIRAHVLLARFRVV